MLPAPSPALTQAELLRLDDFLHSEACGRDAMGLSHAHGFLTALASGPETLEPSEWLRLVFDEPVFRDGEQAEAMLGLALRLYAEIERGLAQPDGFRPVLEFVRGSRGDLTVDATAWCQGYRAGMSLYQELWAAHANQALSAWLAPIHALARSAGPALDPAHGQLCAELPQAVQAINRYWRSLAAAAGPDSSDPKASGSHGI